MDFNFKEEVKRGDNYVDDKACDLVQNTPKSVVFSTGYLRNTYRLSD